MPKRIGLKDIAQALNISVTTVSRGLNNKFDISKSTRDAILQKAKELNYRPNAHAVSLRKNEYFSIGVILPKIDHYFFSTLLKGIMNKAHKANFLVIIGESAHNVEKEQEVIQQFISHCVTGVVVSPANNSEGSNNLETLNNNGIPYVTVDRFIKSSNKPFVKSDDINGGYLAVEHFIENGYKKIAILKGENHCSISNARFLGYKKALSEHNMEFDHRIARNCQTDIEDDGYHHALDLLLSPNRPDAFFAVNDNIALGVYQAAKECGLKIPQEVGVIGFSNSLISKNIIPSLSTVEQQGIEMGEQAFDFLQQSIIGNEHRLNKTFEAKLIKRDSSRRLSAQNSSIEKRSHLNSASAY